MRLVQHIGDSFLDVIENTRWGARGFQLARLTVLGMAILIAGKVASKQFLAFSFDDVLFMAITAVVFLLVMWRWEIGILLILASTSFIMFYDVIPTLSLYHFIPEIPILEQLRLLLGQGIMLYLLALFVLSREARSAADRLRTPLATAVGVFLLTMLVAALVGITFYDVHLPVMVERARPYSFYIMFFVMLLCVRTRKDLLVVLYSCYAMALIVSILMFVQFAAGDRFRVFLGSSVRVEMFGGVAGRILPPGTSLVWLVLPFVIAWIPTTRGARRRVLSFSLMLLLGGLLLTFTRSIWMGVLLSMSIMAILGRGAIRTSILRMVLVVGAFVLMLLAVLSLVSTEEHDYVGPYVDRFTSTFKPESYAEGTSAGARWDEAKAAWEQIVAHPWLGIGIGGIYRYEETWDRKSELHYMQGVNYIHNAYVLILCNSGVIGLTACLAMYITFFVRARKIYRRLRSPADKALVMAAIGDIASVMVASIMQPSFWHPSTVPLIAMAFGLVELIRFFNDEETNAGTDVLPLRPLRLESARSAAGAR